MCPMIKTLKAKALLATALTAALSTPARADTEVDSDQASALITSSAGNITIIEDISLEVSGATPVTIDSNNSVTVEEDAVIEADDANGRAAIRVQDGTDFAITNAGGIYVLEDFLPEDGDSNGIPDGPIAEASGRYGIHIEAGAPTSGSIENEEDAAILVEGLSSFGIAIDSDFTGDIVNDGNIVVVGDNSTALYTQSVDGNLELGGSIAAIGEGARAVVVDGAITGSVIIDGTINKSYSYTNDNGYTLTLSRADLRVATPALTIAGDVDGGIIIAAPPFNLDDEDGDGVDDSDETTGTINAYGESPAVLIGSTEDITIGAGEGREGSHSFIVDGNISSTAYYSAFDTTAVIIGGQGGAVNLPAGIGISGSISTTTSDSAAVALLINTGSDVPTLDISGSITANISSSGEGSVVAIRDLSGTLSNIENSGRIYAFGSNEDEEIALDLGANTSGVTIHQYLNDIDAETKAEEIEDAAADEDDDVDYDPSNPTIYTAIAGDIITGSGDDLLNVSSGRIKSDSYFGAGNDGVFLSDDSDYVGDIYSGTGIFTMGLSDTATFTGLLDTSNQIAQLAISDDATFVGTIENSDQLNVTVDGGVLVAGEGQTLTFDHLEVGAQGTIAIVVDADDKTASSFDVRTASFADGAQLSASVTSLANAEGTYTVLTADSVSGLPEFSFASDYGLPLLYDGDLDADENSLTLQITRKTAEDLGLTGPQSAAFDAIIAAATESEVIEASLLQSDGADSLVEQIDGLLPDYAGGAFDFMTRASRLASRRLADDGTSFEYYYVDGWIEPLYFRGSKNADDSAGFNTSAIGISGGLERDIGLGHLGLSISYLTGSISNGDLQDISAGNTELAGYWRLQSGGLKAFARVSGSRASFSSTRTFSGTIDDTDFSYETVGDWDAWMVSAMVGTSYDIEVGTQFSIRPKAVIDYFRVKEDGYEEDGVDAIDLIVENRTSKSIAATTTMTASYRLGSKPRDEIPLTLELEGGWRSVLQSSLGATTAAFEDGDQFTLAPDALKGGWTTEARVLFGGYDHTFQFAVGAEQTQGDVDLSMRMGLSVAF